jgi:hypothetical protein
MGRLLSELWVEFAGSINLPLAVILTFTSAVLGALIFRKVAFAKSWPALFLLLYIFYPEARWSTALIVGLFAILVWWQATRNPRNHTPNPQNALLLGLAFSFLFFLLYLFTLAPDILPADSGEFQVVATNLGVAHPPGFALYTMLAHLMTRLPVGPSPAYRVNLLSAITSALTLVIVYIAVFSLTKRHLASLVAVIALGTATTFWAQATTANIRSLSALFTAAIFTLLLAINKSAHLADEKTGVRIADRYLFLFAFLFGLGITHHASLVFMGFIFIIFILLVDPGLLRSPRRWWRPFLAFLLGLLPLLYLVLRASSGARGAAPELATWPGFLEHVLALGFRGDLFTYLEPALLWERLGIMGNVLTFQFEPILIIGIALGFLLLLWHDRRLAFLLGGAFLVHTFITATYRAPQTVEYMLPAYVPLALLLGYAAGQSTRLWTIAGSGRFRQTLQPLLLSILLITSFWQLSRHYSSFRQLHFYKTARDYAQPLLLEAPDNSVILADWHWVTPLWYLQEVEGLRQDVSIRYIFPEGEPYGRTWAKRIAGELTGAHDVISTHFDQDAYQDLPVPEPVGEAFLFRQEPRLEMPQNFTPLDNVLGDRIQLLGYALSGDTVPIAGEVTVTLAWMPLAELNPATGLFAHLVSPEGQIFAQQDLPANPQLQGITLTQFRLVPRLGALPGAYALMVGAADEEVMLNEAGEPRSLLSALTVTSQDQPYATANPLKRKVPGADLQQLVGFDWDNTLADAPRLYLHWQTKEGYQTDIVDEPIDVLPPYVGPWGVLSQGWSSVLTPHKGYYVPLGQGIVWRGEPLSSDTLLLANESITLSQHFLSSQPVMRDHTVSTRLIGFEDDGFHWAWWDLDDAIPAMGAIPTLKWIAGSRVRSPHFLTVDPTATPGKEIGGALNLYDAFTGRTLPILDDRLTSEFGWIPLGLTTISEP